MHIFKYYPSKSLRTIPRIGRSLRHRPRLEALEGRALLSAIHIPVHSGVQPSVTVSAHSPAIVAGFHSTQLNVVHSGHVHNGTIHILAVRHAIAK
jgi:hypothetical protein